MYTKDRAKILFFVFAVILVLTCNTAAASSISMDRLYGSDRYGTAIAISQAGWESSDYAVLARGDDFADALCAGPLAHRYGAPILLTQPDGINSDTLAELRRLGVKHVFIIGGQAAVSDDAEEALRSSGIADIERLYGDDRYQTSARIADRLGDISQAVLATGSDFPDALSISVIAARLGMPILLADKNNLPDSIKSYMSTKNITTTYIAGGNGAVGSGIENLVPNPVRLSGNSRYETNINILKHFENYLDFSNIYVAVGEGPAGNEFADALTGAVLAAVTSSPLILVNDGLPSVTGDYLRSSISIATRVTGLGGENAVSSSILDSIMAFKEQPDAEEYYGTAGTYGPENGTVTISGNVIIGASGVTLRNTKIEGGLLLAESIGDGSVTLSDVTVNGKTIVNGGGPNSIYLFNFDGETVEVDVPDGTGVRLVARGDTSISHVSMRSNGILEETELMFTSMQEGGFINVGIHAGSQVTLNGNFQQVNLEAPGAGINLTGGYIGSLNIAGNAAGASVNLSHGTNVGIMTVNSPAGITGQGRINRANINSGSVIIAQTPTFTAVANGITASVGGLQIRGSSSSQKDGGSVIPPAQTAPTFSPGAGAVAFGTELTIASSGADNIYYTTDGTDPATSVGGSTQLYDDGAKPVINTAMTVKAIAVKEGIPSSDISSAAYTQAATSDLTSLVISGGPAGYTFNPDTYVYEGITVPYSTGSITITPSGTGIITVDGVTVTNGSASGEIALTPAVERTITVIAAETGKSPKAYTIKITRDLINEAEILSYSLPSQTGPAVINNLDGTIMIEVAFGTDVRNLTASFTTSACIQDISIGGITQVSGSTSNDFSSPVTYAVTAQNGEEKNWMVTVAAEPEFSGGNGNIDSPYLISNAVQLDRVRNHMSSYFKQVDNIDLSQYGSGMGWNPIGSYSNSFNGFYDGDNYSITNMRITRPDTSYIGLFGCVGSSGTLQNICLENIIVTGKSYTGGLAGCNRGDLDNCFTSGQVSSGTTGTGSDFGGLAGSNEAGGSALYCHSSADISVTGGSGAYGGLIGSNDGSLAFCYATGDVSGSMNGVGGLVGANFGDITHSFAAGDVSGMGAGDYIGGLVGYMDDVSGSVTATYCYATGNVSGRSQVGGLIGMNFKTVSCCYSAGIVTGTGEYIGGLVGHSTTDPDNSYYNSETSGQGGKGTGLSTAGMCSASSFSGWAIGGDTPVWLIHEGVSYPYLYFQTGHIPFPQ